MRMGVLTKHLIRAHLGPFLFALFAITGLIFLNAVALRIEGLVGKGLPWTVIVQFLLLSLPHTVALSIPMAVLASVLYAFSDLATSNEITAMAAGGIRPTSLLVPLLGMGAVATIMMLIFNDSVLPEANHRLKNLLVDVSRKSPTFQLRENVLNRIDTNDDQVKYYLTAARIDPMTNTLEDVTIFDVNDPLRKRITHADHGTMAFNAARTDLYLTLYDGVVREVQNDKNGGFQRLYFQKQVVPMRGVGDQLDLQLNATQRSDREMDFGMLQHQIDIRKEELDSVLAQSKAAAVKAVRTALAIEKDSAAAGAAVGPLAGHASRPRSGEGLLQRDQVTRSLVVSQRTRATRTETLLERINQLEVEIYKKLAIAFACLVFTLVGPPLALRFPRGGVGMVIAASTGIFAIYWVGLIGGESLADKDLGSPFFTMWIPNIVFTILGLVLLRHMARAGGNTRGSGWGELWYRVRTGAAKLFARRPARAAG